jgi:hypothetical protein
LGIHNAMKNRCLESERVNFWQRRVSEDEIDENVHYLVLEEGILQDLVANHQFSRRSPKILYEFPEKIPTRDRLVKLD